jgi:serine/threonine protein kinase
MEYLDGVTLEDLVTHAGPQPAARVVHILRQICGALTEAHGAGLIHRDIKPANLMLSLRGGVADHLKVLVFGLVKEQAAGDARLSTTGVFVGTPAYLAPEAITDPTRPDFRSDLYAVGAVGYFLLTGKPVFDGTSSVEVCAQHLHREPVAPSARSGISIPASLERLVLRCLAKKPAARPDSASALGEALAALDDVDMWTTHEAQRWWDTEAASVRDAIQANRHKNTTPGRQTVAVDLRDRSVSAD